MWPRIAIFLAIFLALVGLTHYYLWARLIRDPALPAPWDAIGHVVLGVLAITMVAGALMARGPRDAAAPVAWVGFIWLGVLFYLLVFFGAADLARGAVALVRKLTEGDPPLDPERRVALARIVAGTVGFAAAAVSGTALASGLRPVEVKKVKVALGKLPSSLEGYTIVQLSDVHVGSTIGRAFIEELVSKVNALKPDLVAITGDLVDGSVEQLGELVRPLSRIRAKDGVFFVTGNHEYYSGASEWMRFLDSIGVRVLRNERVAIRGQAGFDLAGVHDWTAHQFGEGANLSRALDGRDESRALVLLAHQPKQIEEAADLGVDLQLSGHTHGGQLFPFRYLVGLQQPYVEGLHMHGRAQIYVSSGTGYWGPPMRLLAPAEITQIELAPT